MLHNLCRRFMISKMHKIIANTAQSVYDLNHVPDILVARFRDITRYRYCLFYRKMIHNIPITSYQFEKYN